MTGPGRPTPGTPGDPLDVGLGNGPTGPADGEPAAPPPAPPQQAPQAPQKERHAGRTIGRTLALALLIFVTVLLVLFVVFNGQTVQISLVFTDVQGPLVLALLIAAALGGLLVWLAGLVRRARRRKR
ncbi:lipopolysaccharide assembly protein LapA domain-containing protein [Blastococcus capsensis]|uniref:lipopolysaccharide assembly protein LapA domain-containing protein n=1 Tax=Blastococcus capsensis TaxID=1564163 RepID=UPI002540BFB1|nr:lipopolysaccharide assembly protein LapA domain-containing protein [Blastococcus capsensis]MDK3255495.1 lipopolysaccharide assembly protein LapA domain-containing protein [Blastococcus capsensis]